MYAERCQRYAELERLRESRVLVYITGDRPGMETQIHSEALDFFADHLDTFDLPRRISLYLYSRGGETLAGWSIVNLIRHFCDEFEVIVPSKARSTATLIALGADRIVMTKQATLGPIDPSTNSPFNPQFPGGSPVQRLPVSVEDVAAYFDLARSQDVKSDEQLTRVFEKLAAEVHPLALGNVYRARAQIQQLADRLLRTHIGDDDVIRRLVAVLCSESGSHDYTINRREAEHELGLPVAKPDDRLYAVIRAIHDEVRQELKLNQRFDTNEIAAPLPPPAPPATPMAGVPVPTATVPTVSYECPRILIESLTGGSHRFVSKGIVSKVMVNGPVGPQIGAMDQRQFEGWEYEKTP